MSNNSKRVGIIGAGLTGLTAARILARAGHAVIVCEAGPEPGGLAGTFTYAGTRLEKFYHHFFTTDLDTIRLIKELGLEERIIWRETPMGMYKNGKLMKFATPWDLLRFTPLSFFNRLRFGLVILYLSRVKHWQKYENISAREWIRRAFGEQAWETVWGPLLHGKFGEYAKEIGMPWFYSRVHTRAGSREKGMTKESLGYLKGSFQVLHQALVRDIEAYGGEVRFNEKVERLSFSRDGLVGWKTSRREEEIKTILATLAPAGLLSLLPQDQSGEYWDQLRNVQYLGNVCAVLTLKRSLSPIYWMNIPDVSSPFIAVIEHTNFISRETYNGQHVDYLSSYLPITHPRYQAPEPEILNEYYAYLAKVVSGFTPDDVAEAKVFRATYAQPVIRTGFAKNIVNPASPIKGLYISNMAQIYPEDRGMSYSIRLGEQAAGIMAAMRS